MSDWRGELLKEYTTRKSQSASLLTEYNQCKGVSMKTMKFTYWQDGNYYLGFLNDYPDYQTQGMSKEELANSLKDLLADLESGEVPYIRKVEELVVAE